ncbi:hypothetical protein RJ639_013526 [Escallonia herrerae]|uniref:Zeta toxin domain-containing protein n=1 Tax=Escallonia herrerae TaxID=1293975 RepID=A0AA88VHS1_9ASTE|nr:hypothetical protein RJ639_013526 [Escallonia herrerae]
MPSKAQFQLPLISNSDIRIMQKDGYAKLILAATTIGFVSAAAMHYGRKKSKISSQAINLVPLLEMTESGRVRRVESFPYYVGNYMRFIIQGHILKIVNKCINHHMPIIDVCPCIMMGYSHGDAARQIGFKDGSECPQLCKLANDYLVGSRGCMSSFYEYFGHEPDLDSLYVKLVEECERCILGYFAFHWSQASLMITQALSSDSHKKKRLRDFVMVATRYKGRAFGPYLLGKMETRFQRVVRDLKIPRVFSTLVQEMEAISSSTSSSELHITDLMVPMAYGKRSPVLLLMGGGAGAGKSTILKQILRESFWLEAANDALVIDADAFKVKDVVYKALQSYGHHEDMLPTSELVHQSSIDSAASLLVTALNEGRDVIMDGTLSWEPFVEQTIAMARNVHKCYYRMGVGYKVAEDGTVTENYWEQVYRDTVKQMKPYRIELVGVLTDACVAVVRGIRIWLAFSKDEKLLSCDTLNFCRRAISTGRAVRVKSQLNSHKRFANAFPRYCNLVDHGRLYCTDAVGGPPRVRLSFASLANEIRLLTTVSNLNIEAESVYELYAAPNVIYESGSVWKDIVLSPTRASSQLELKTAIEKIEKPMPRSET